MSHHRQLVYSEREKEKRTVDLRPLVFYLAKERGKRSFVRNLKKLSDITELKVNYKLNVDKLCGTLVFAERNEVRTILQQHY